MIEIIECGEVVEDVTDLATFQDTKNEMSVHQELMSLKDLMSMAETLSNSTVIPASYQRKPENCVVALDMAQRTGMSPFVIMQNLYVIQGKPSWSGQAVASMIRASSNFKNVELNYIGEVGKDSWGAYITATRVSSGQTLRGGTVTIGIAKKEGWFQKAGSKWQTTPELMLAYRAYSWFGRVYAPELMMGFQTVEEVQDVSKVETVERENLNPYTKVVD